MMLGLNGHEPRAPSHQDTLARLRRGERGGAGLARLAQAGAIEARATRRAWRRRLDAVADGLGELVILALAALGLATLLACLIAVALGLPVLS